MAKKGGAGREREAGGEVPFRGRDGGAEPAYTGGAEGEAGAEVAPAGKSKRKARVVPIARARASAEAGPGVKARAGRVGVAAAEPAEETQTRARRQAPGFHPTAKLAGKVALITGGDSAVGRAVARLFAREGADAAVVYSPGELSVAAELRGEVEAAGQHALLLPGDVREPGFCRQAVERAVGEFGQLDVLVHAARYAAQGRAIEELPYEDWDHAFKTSIYSLFLMAQAAAPKMARGGAMIAVGMAEGPGDEWLGHLLLKPPSRWSGCGRASPPGNGRPLALRASPGCREQMPLDYAATQGAMHAFTRVLAQQLGERGIRVNGVVGIAAKPEEAAPACVFFASADAGHISGETIALG